MSTTITDDHIAQLQTEAAQAGDDAQVALCARALLGDADARAECERVIREALERASEEG